MIQLELLSQTQSLVFPPTRYQGSKRKYTDWIADCLGGLTFSTALDAFGGSGAVAYKLKQIGASVTYNDKLLFNSIIGKALIENDTEVLSEKEINFVLRRHDAINYPTFIEDTFEGIYFTREENRWLDQAITNIATFDNPYKRAIAFFSVFQSCLIKRPYNLFHRKNLYVRFQDVKRTFGNKTSWDTPFEVYFPRFVDQANSAIFFNGRKNFSINADVNELPVDFDLVYLDPPYLSARGGGVDYLDFYHFLEGIANYDVWKDMIDFKTPNLKMKASLRSDWTTPNRIRQAFSQTIQRYRNSILAISYRADGIPSIDEIVEILRSEGRTPRVFKSCPMRYVLSKKTTSEILILA